MMKPAIKGGRPVRQQMLPYAKQYIDDDDCNAVVEALKSDYLTTGPAVQKFEQDVADYVGAEYAVTFTNGTAALHAACYAAGIGPGDEVITTPITFAASANCVLYLGGTPVFADIHPDTFNINVDEIAKKITSKTKAIIPVDFTGQAVDLDAVYQLVKGTDIVVIEDSAHALGTRYKDKRVGGIADMTEFSFHPVKTITTGEGGIITTNSTDYYSKLTSFRTHGITRNRDLFEAADAGSWHYEQFDLGFNYRMTDIQAALGVSQMKKLDGFIARRKELVAMYNEAFGGLDGVIVQRNADYSDTSQHFVCVEDGS